MHRSPATSPDRRPAEGDVARTFDRLGYRYSVAGGTRIGHRYPANFDVLHVDRATPFVAVIDGMGGGEGSAVAGSTAMSTFVAAVRAAGPEVGPAQLRNAIAEAQERVGSAGARLGELTGCTLTALVLGAAGVSGGDGASANGSDRAKAWSPDPAAEGVSWSPGSPTWNAPTALWTAASPGRIPATAGAGLARPGAGPARGGPAAVAWADRASGAGRNAGHPTGARAGTGPTGTTLTGSAPPSPREGWIVQIGDSRAYRLRDGRLELLTVDHTEAWLGTLHGWYPADSPQAAAARYRLNRYVGHPDSPEPDLLNVSLLPGDVYCVCTDGVTDEIGYPLLAGRLGSAADPVKIVHALLADTLAAGGRDNATLAILRVEAD